MLENFWAYLEAVGFICLTSPVRLVKRLRRFSAPTFIDSTIEIPILESEFREKLQPKEKLIERSGIELGMIVLELGCGSGVYPTNLAKVIGREGKLYTVDLKQEMIDRLKRKLEEPEYKDLSNIETKVASAYELPFQDKSIDLVLMVAVLGEIQDKGKELKEICRILKPSGFLIVPDYPLRRTTKEYCEQGGYKIRKESGNFLNYTLQFKKG